MRMRFAIAGAVIGTVAGITIGRTVRRWRTWGVDPDRGGQGACRATTWSRRPPPSTPAGSPSTRRRRPSGRGSSRWASGGRAGTATTGMDMRGKSADSDRARVADARGRRHRADRSRRRLRRSRSSSPGRALVALHWTRHWSRARLPRRHRRASRAMPAGLAASGAILRQTPHDFAAAGRSSSSPLDGGGTRLIERFRVRVRSRAGPRSGSSAPFIGFGVFVMMQRQMLGIRDRARANGRRAAVGGLDREAGARDKATSKPSSQVRPRSWPARTERRTPAAGRRRVVRGGSMP